MPAGSPPIASGPASDGMTVLVSEEMRRLWRRLRRAAPEADEPTRSSDTPARRPAPSTPPAVPRGPAPFPARRISLRRDGARPLVFDGALVAATRLQVGCDASIEVRLHRDVEGGLAVHIARIPDDGDARPFHTAQRLADPAGLDAVLRHGVQAGQLPDAALSLRRMPPSPQHPGDP